MKKLVLLLAFVLSACGGSQAQQTPNFWVSAPFNAADFSGAGSMTWTVEPSDVESISYVISDKTMIVSYAIKGTSTNGGGASLFFKIPAGKVATRAMYNTVWIRDGDANAKSIGIAIASGSFITIQKTIALPFNASTNQTSVVGQIAFEIQ